MCWWLRGPLRAALGICGVRGGPRPPLSPVALGAVSAAAPRSGGGGSGGGTAALAVEALAVVALAVLALAVEVLAGVAPDVVALDVPGRRRNGRCSALRWAWRWPSLC